MCKALSVELLKGVIAAIDMGLSGHVAGARSGVSAASAIRWRGLFFKAGDMRPSPLGGDQRSGLIEKHAELVCERLESRPDITLAEMQAALAEYGGLRSGGSSVAQRSRSKGSAHADKQSGPDILT